MAAHRRGCVDVSKVLAVAPRFADLPGPSPEAEAASAAFEWPGDNARPLGDAAFLACAESLLGRSLAPRRPGRKPGAGTAAAGAG